MPIFGICLGHQLFGLTFGAKTVKMPYGHRGGNHPVREIETGRILITSQNHGFAVQGSEQEIPGAPALEVTHVNLNDGTVEGLRHRELPDLRRPVPPGGRAGPARRPAAVRAVHGNGAKAAGLKCAKLLTHKS